LPPSEGPARVGPHPGHKALAVTAPIGEIGITRHPPAAEKLAAGYPRGAGRKFDAPFLNAGTAQRSVPIGTARLGQS
jgi:hypothetical protein